MCILFTSLYPGVRVTVFNTLWYDNCVLITNMRNCIRVVDTTSCTVYGTKQQLPSLVNLYNICRQTDTKNNHTIYGLYQNFTDLTCLSCVKVLESQRHGLVKSIQVPHTYSVSQSLPPYVYLCRNTHPNITRLKFKISGNPTTTTDLPHEDS